MYHSWTRTAALWLSFATLASSASAQTQSVGFRDQVIANPTGVGSTGIAVRIFYPGKANGQNEPRSIAPANGWPVLVWLPGFGALGSNYPALCNHVAGNGYVVVALNSTANDIQLQRDDGSALFAALTQETQKVASFFHSAFDMSRVALAGHSMGGANMVRILAKNPGYRMGIGFATWQGPLINGVSFPHLYAKDVRVPVLLLHGEGDITIPWADSAKLYYDRLVNCGEFAVLHRMNKNCDHANLVSLLATHTPSVEVFFESMSVALSALELELGKVASAVDGVVGESARGHVHYAAQEARLARTAVWVQGQPKLGAKLSVNALAGQGDLLLVVGVRGQLNTPWGILGLDPASLVVFGHRRTNLFGETLSSEVRVPQRRNLIGVEFCFQAISSANGVSERLALTVVE